MQKIKLVLFTFLTLHIGNQIVIAAPIEVDDKITVEEFQNLMEDPTIEQLNFPPLSSRDFTNDSRKGSKVYFLFGFLEAKWTNYEYSHALAAIRSLQSAGWEVGVDGSTSKEEAQRYFKDSELAAIYWSSHGTKDGYLTTPTVSGAAEAFAPIHISEGGKNIQLGVFCACYSAVLASQYSTQLNSATIYGYAGTTTAKSCAAVLKYQFIPLFNKHVN